MLAARLQIFLRKTAIFAHTPRVRAANDRALNPYKLRLGTVRPKVAWLF